jgi:F-type H+/Na+-transporting ATPase subunit alpha
MESNSISSKVKKIEDSLHQELDNLFKIKTGDDLTEGKVGYVTDFADGVGHISGLDNARIGQKLSFPESWERAKLTESEDEPEILGLAVDVDEDSIGAIVFGEEKFVKQGDKVVIAEDLMRIPVTEKMLGRVLDPFGRAIDGKKVPDELEWLGEDLKVKEGILCLPIERKAPGVIDRSKINEPLQTGVKAVDSMLPIGRGQRMLIIGDRATGKTAVGMDTIVNQNKINRELDRNRGEGFDIHNVDTHDPRTVYCIYVAIGRKASEIRQLVQQLEFRNSMEYTIIISAMANDPASLLYIAPFSGCTIGEYFRDRGKHALIIYDDLSKHATAYRQISLLLRRPPGREAYPGDIFYLHSRLLERASKICGRQNVQLDLSEITPDYQLTLKPIKEMGLEIYGGGSLTALPYVETKQNDYASYIPTNIISITDGQVYLSDKLFNEGFRPPINIGISVSRVGSKAQTLAMKEVADGLKGYLANYREKEKYTKFGLNPTDEDLQVLERGRRLIHFLKQPQYAPVEVEREVLGLFTVRRGYFDVLPDNERLIRDFDQFIWESLAKDSDLAPKIVELRKPNVELSSLLTNEGRLFIQRFSDLLHKLQFEFMKEREIPGFEVMDIFFPALVAFKEEFYNEMGKVIDSLLDKPSALSGSVISSFVATSDMIPKEIKIRPFAKADQAPAELKVSNYKSDIFRKFLFNYFLEEKQKLKKEFFKKCEKEFNFAEEKVDEGMKKKIEILGKSFLRKDKEESKARLEKIVSKRDDFIKNYLSKQIIEIQKIKVAVIKQKKIVEANKTLVKIDDFNRHYDSLMKDMNNLFENLKEIVRKIDISTQIK